MPDSNSWWKYNFDIAVKGQGYTEFMYVGNTLYHGDTLMCQQSMTMSIKGQKSWGLNTKLCHKPYKFDLEVVSGTIQDLHWNINKRSMGHIAHLREILRFQYHFTDKFLSPPCRRALLFIWKQEAHGPHCSPEKNSSNQ